MDGKMKILYHILYPYSITADRFIYEGYKYAWQDKGHEFYIVTAFDDLRQKFEEVKPDLFFSLWNYFPRKIPQDTDIVKEFKKKGVKIFIDVSPILCSRPTPKELAVLRDSDFADVYRGSIRPKRSVEFERMVGKPYHFIPWAASKHLHFPSSSEKKYECDLVFIGANLPAKQAIFQKFLFPLFKKYDVKIYGALWTWKDTFFRLGAGFNRRLGIKSLTNFFDKRRLAIPTLEEERKIYSSAKIGLNFHVYDERGVNYDELNERGFKIPACGGFQTVDYVPSMWRFFEPGKEVVMATKDNDPKDWFSKIDYYLRHDAERKEIQEAGTKRALSEHTYHNRVDQIIGIYNRL